MASPNFKIAAQLYDPLPLPISAQTGDGTFSIRLLSVTSAPGEPISCRLKATPFHDAATRGYFALSYVWGDASITEEIRVNGFPFQATRNLVLALKWFSRSEYVSHPLWVDAVCINQCNIPERNDQVPRMGSIYTSCWEALCFLGPDADEKDAKLFHTITALCQDIDHPDMWGDNPALSPLKNAFYAKMVDSIGGTSLLRAPALQDRVYWTRVWTFQEAVLAPAALLVVGDSKCYVQDIERIADWVYCQPVASLIQRNKAPEGIDVAVWKMITDILLDIESDTWLSEIVLARRHLLFPNTRPVGRLFSMAQRTLARNCYDARDKLYGLAGIVDIGIKVDYDAPVKDVYTSFAANAIPQADDLFYVFSFTVNGQAGSKYGVPSWVLDLTTDKQLGLNKEHYLANLNAPPAAKAVTVDGDILQVNGTVMDIVEDVMLSVTQNSTKQDEKWRRSRISTVSRFLLGQDAKAILADTIPAVSGSRLYKTGIPMLEAVLRLLSDDMELRHGLFSTDPRSHIRPEAIPGLVDALIAELPDDDPRKQIWLTQPHEPTNLDKVKGILTQTLDPERPQPLDPSEVISAARVAHDAQKSARDLEMRDNPFVESPLAVPFHTKMGYIGYGLDGLQNGDLVCVLGCCSMPVILREVDEAKRHYKLVSLCHVLGAKHGEVWSWGRQVEEFKLV